MGKRICLVRQKFYPAQRNLRRNAEALVAEGHHVDIICIGKKGEKRYETLNGVNVHRIYYSYHRDSAFWYIFDYLLFFILATVTLSWYSLKKKYDVIEVHTMPDFLVFATLLPKLMGSKVILYYFENAALLFMEGYKKSEKNIVVRIIRWVAKISGKYADHIIVSDGPLHKKSVEDFGIPGEKITTILNVPDESVFNPNVTPIRDDGNHFHVVVVSTILKRYGIHVLINALPKLIKEIPEIHVDIIGDGDYLPVLQKRAASLGVAKYMTFTGYLPYEKVSSYVGMAEVCVAPMINDVGAPNKIFEYFAMGKAAVVSDLPGPRALVDDNCALYFSPGDEKELASKILELYASPEKRDSLGRAALACYHLYHWPLMKQEYLNVYKRLFGG